MAQRGQLPVEHRQDARLGRMEDHIVQAVVAVHDAGLVLRRDVLRQPFDQLLHRLDLLGLRGAVLLGPAADLALQIVARLAVVAQADRVVVDLVQRGDHAVHLVVDGGALARGVMPGSA